MTSPNSVTSHLHEFQRVIGFKDYMDVGRWVDMYQARDYLKLCRAIGAQMKLPNEIALEEATASTPFRTYAMSPTDEAGRGTQGIVAQVTIPENLPIYGTPAFAAHIIRITTGDAIGKIPAETAIAIIAHELSHILLHSLRHHDRDSEKCTDLVPIALGFANIVRSGRVVTTSTRAGNVTTTLTTTYGYLSDAEFEEAAATVKAAVTKWRSDAAAVANLLGRSRRESERTKREIERVRRLLLALDQSRRRVRISDGARIVAMHAPGYFDDRRSAVDAVLRSWFNGMPTIQQAMHYTTNVAAELEAAIEGGERGMVALSHLRADAHSDARILNRSQSLLSRAIEWIRHRWR